MYQVYFCEEKENGGFRWSNWKSENMLLKPRSGEKIPVISAKVLPLRLVCSGIYPFIFLISLLFRGKKMFNSKNFPYAGSLFHATIGSAGQLDIE